MADPTNTEDRAIVTRAEAKAAGAKRYFTGKPCSRGHVAERFVSIHSCVTCLNAHKVERRAAIRATAAPKPRADKKAWAVANREKMNAWRRAWRTRNRAHFLAWQSAYRKANPDKVRAWAGSVDLIRRNANTAALRAANPEKFRVYKTHRRARECQATGRHSAADIRALLTTQHGKCAHSWCRKSLASGYHIDHVLPLKLGGSNGRRNIQLLCQHCNLSKSDTHPIDYARRNGMLL